MSSDSDNNSHNNAEIKPAPVPLPRTIFNKENADNEPAPKNIKRQTSRSSGKSSKTAYSMIKNLFPRPRPRQNHLPRSDHRPLPRRRPRRSPTNSNSSDSPREFLNGDQNFRNASLPKTAKSTIINEREISHPSNQDILDEKKSNNYPSGYIDAENKSSTNSKSIEKSNQSKPIRSPPPVPEKKSSRRISSIDQLHKTAQKATEYDQNAQKDMANNNYMKAAKKYERCLNYIDDVLETPLRRLSLSPTDETHAAEIMQDMKLLRKSVLQGFSDSQTTHTLPQNMAEMAPDAPPSYNDVLNADLLESNNEVLTGVSPLEPKLVAVSSSLIDFSVDENHSKNHISVRPKQFKTPKPPNHTRNSKPRSRQIEMPPDVVLRKSPVEDEESNKKEIKDSKYVSTSTYITSMNDSVDSSFSDASFVTAFSSPAPKEKTSEHESVFDSLDSTTGFTAPQVLDPFRYEDPFHNNGPKNEDNSFTFPDIGNMINPHKNDSKEISFLSPNSIYAEVISKKKIITRPYEDYFSQEKVNDASSNKKYSNAIDAQKAVGNDQFRLLNEEFRKKFAIPSDKAIIVNESINSTTSKTNETTSTKISDEDTNSIYMNTLDLETNQFSTLSRNARHYQSDVNLATPKSKQKSPRNKKLLKVKGISRSNESVLLMFDPCIQEENEFDEYTEDDQLIPHENISISNPIYGTASSEYINSIINDSNVNTLLQNIDDNGEAVLITINNIDKEDNDIQIEKDSNKNTVLTSVEPKSQDDTVKEEKVISTNEIRKSLYPKLPVDENLNDRPLPPIPIRKSAPPPIPNLPKNYKPKQVHKHSVAEDSNDNSVVTRVEKCNKYQSQNSIRNSSQPERASIFLRNKDGFTDVIDNSDKVDIGKSSFYKPSTVEESTFNPPLFISDSPSSPKNIANSNSAEEPYPPLRTSSKRKTSTSWQEVMHVPEAVKLFFLGDSDVSSPFNRQSLTVMRRDWANSVDNQGEARVEIGGELFVLDLQGKTTRVMQDHRGDYIIHSTAGVFLCVSPCQPMKRGHLFSLEKTFEIYGNFVKDTQGARSPGDMDNEG